MQDRFIMTRVKREYVEEFRRAIIDECEKRGLGQVDVAKALGISTQRVNNYWKGRTRKFKPPIQKKLEAFYDKLLASSSPTVEPPNLPDGLEPDMRRIAIKLHELLSYAIDPDADTLSKLDTIYPVLQHLDKNLVEPLWKDLHESTHGKRPPE